jgi:putative SOS response-associated peptidase YedK
MCGRFKLNAPFSELVRLYRLTNNVNLGARYNIAPTQQIATVRVHEGQRTLDMLRWGLIPAWAKDKKIGYSTINAKAETIQTAPVFRDAFRSKRCLILADGFYEWKKLGPKEKQPYLFQMRDKSPFGFAGLWDSWRDRATNEVVESCTIITTEANKLCEPIHNRMPVILYPEDHPMWLGEEPAMPDHLHDLLVPYDAEQMEAVRIGPRVGNVKHDDADLVTPINSA